MRARLILVLTAFVCLIGTSQAQAKGPTVQLSITGPGLDVPFIPLTRPLSQRTCGLGTLPTGTPALSMPRQRQSRDFASIFGCRFLEAASK